MHNYIQLVTSAGREYIQHNIKQKIDEIVSQENIRNDEIKSKVDSFPDASNINLLKDSVKLLHKNGCLNKENLALIGSEEGFQATYFTNGILKKLDDVNLINQENLEWILKGTYNVLYWNIHILHKNSQLTPRNLQALRDTNLSSTLSRCFTQLLLLQRPAEDIPERFRTPPSEDLISDCSNTFFKFGVNPITTRLPSEFDTPSNLNYRTDATSNLFFANFVLYQLNKLFGKSNPPAEKPAYTHEQIYERLDRIENLLIRSIEKYSDTDNYVAEPELSRSSSAAKGFFGSIIRSETNAANFEQPQQIYSP